jgi:transposase
MIPVPPGVRVLVWSTPVDFRAGMDRLAALVQVTLRLDPFAGDVFVFRSRRPDRVKLLVYDGTGLILITKRLEAGRFKWPPVTDGVVRLSALQLSVLLALGAFAGAADFPPKRRLLRGKCRPDWLAQV